METNKEIPTAYQFCQSHSLVDSYGKADEFMESELIKLINQHLSKQAEVIAEKALVKTIIVDLDPYTTVDKQSIINASEEYKNNVK